MEESRRARSLARHLHDPAHAFHRDGILDEDSLRREGDFVIAGGAHGIVAPVNTGELEILTIINVSARLPGVITETATRAVSSEASCCRPGAPAGERWPFVAADARLLKALADETRLGIVLQLREQGEVCQCDFVACCTIAQPTVSHHLKVLKQAGVVVGEKRGVWVHYRLNPTALDGLRRYLA